MNFWCIQYLLGVDVDVASAAQKHPIGQSYVICTRPFWIHQMDLVRRALCNLGSSCRPKRGTMVPALLEIRES